LFDAAMPKNVPLFQTDESALRALAPDGAVRAFAKGSVIINEGDETDSLYVVLSGRAKIYVSEEDGREVVVNTVGPGEYFGELVLDGGPRSASVMALEPCRFFIIPREDIEQLIESNPAFARDLIHKLIERVRDLTDKVRDLALKSVYNRFVRFLDENSVERDGRRFVSERLTQHDIAARIGGSREMVSRIIKDLTIGGYISIDSKYITIHKKPPLNW
jgi:CRP/FNR family transcriptional regulator, cyclic AMP receptor protein